VNIIDELTKIVGPERVSDDTTVLYTYSRDASLITGTADYVTRPVSTEEVSKIVSLASKHKIPIVPRGIGSGLEGGCVPVHGGIVLDMHNMDKIIEIDTESLHAVVEPGVVHADLNARLAESDFFFSPDPASTDFCTIGGMIGTNASGMTCLKYGDTRKSVLGLEVVLADGSVINTGSKTVKSDCGYDLTALFVGADGTLGVVTKAILKVIPRPRARATVAVYFDRVEKIGEAVTAIFASGIIPAACELMDRSVIKAVNQYKPEIGLPDVDGMLIINLEGSEATVKEEVAGVVSACQKVGAIEVKAAATQEEADRLWQGRRAVGSAIYRLDPKKAAPNIAGDYGVPIKRLPEILKEVRRITEESGITIVAYGHVGDGNLHTAMAVNILDEEELARAEKAGDAIYEAVLKLEGTTAPEHGIGVSKIRWVQQESQSSYPLMQAIKKVLDPQNIMNPGKIFEIS
jgi:glycolate oxidase subunit GlcD